MLSLLLSFCFPLSGTAFRYAVRQRGQAAPLRLNDKDSRHRTGKRTGAGLDRLVLILVSAPTLILAYVETVRTAS